MAKPLPAIHSARRLSRGIALNLQNYLSNLSNDNFMKGIHYMPKIRPQVLSFKQLGLMGLQPIFDC